MGSWLPCSDDVPRRGVLLANASFVFDKGAIRLGSRGAFVTCQGSRCTWPAARGTNCGHQTHCEGYPQRTAASHIPIATVKSSTSNMSSRPSFGIRKTLRSWMSPTSSSSAFSDSPSSRPAPPRPAFTAEVAQEQWTGEYQAVQRREASELQRLR
ncbi:unnamed protein product, partial [Rhizoctonia solani]